MAIAAKPIPPACGRGNAVTVELVVEPRAAIAQIYGVSLIDPAKSKGITLLSCPHERSRAALTYAGRALRSLP